MWSFFHKLSSPKYYYEWSGKWIPWLGGITILLTALGVYWGLVIAPTDYQQGESYRIIFIHVPAAWMRRYSGSSPALRSRGFPPLIRRLAVW